MSSHIQPDRIENLLGYVLVSETEKMGDLLGLPPIARRGGGGVETELGISDLVTSHYPHYVPRFAQFACQDYKSRRVLAGYSRLVCLDSGGVAV